MSPTDLFCPFNRCIFTHQLRPSKTLSALSTSAIVFAFHMVEWRLADHEYQGLAAP